MTINPSGSLRAKQGTRVSLRGDVSLLVRSPRIVFNGKESDVIPSDVVGASVKISVPPFEAVATYVGGNATHFLFQFDFMLLSEYDDASIRIVAVSGGVATKVYSPFLNLTVLCKTSENEYGIVF